MRAWAVNVTASVMVAISILCVLLMVPFALVVAVLNQSTQGNK